MVLHCDSLSWSPALCRGWRIVPCGEDPSPGVPLCLSREGTLGLFGVGGSGRDGSGFRAHAFRLPSGNSFHVFISAFRQVGGGVQAGGGGAQR